MPSSLKRKILPPKRSLTGNNKSIKHQLTTNQFGINLGGKKKQAQQKNKKTIC